MAVPKNIHYTSIKPSFWVLALILKNWHRSDELLGEAETGGSQGFDGQSYQQLISDNSG